MAWIESHQEVGRHPKTKRLARLLGEKMAAAIGYLHLLWWWAIDYAPDGDLSKYAPEDVADGVGWDGEPTRLLSALKESGWVDENGAIHDWWEYGGKLIAKRKEDSARKKPGNARNSNGTPMEVAGESNGSRAEATGTVHTSHHTTQQTEPNITSHHTPDPTDDTPEDGGGTPLDLIVQMMTRRGIDLDLDELQDIVHETSLGRVEISTVQAAADKTRGKKDPTAYFRTVWADWKSKGE